MKPFLRLIASFLVAVVVSAQPATNAWRDQFTNTSLGDWSCSATGSTSNVCFNGTVVCGSGTCQSANGAGIGMVASSGTTQSESAFVYRSLGSYANLDGMLVFAYQDRDNVNTVEILITDGTPSASDLGTVILGAHLYFGFTNVTTDGVQIAYNSSPGTSGTRRYWDGSTWSASNSHTGISNTDDYYVIGVEFDTSQGVRVVQFSQNDTSGSDLAQGLIIYTMTDWVTWATLGNPTDLYVWGGDTYTDFLGSNEGPAWEFMHWYETVQPGFDNGRENGTPDWDIHALRCYSGTSGAPEICVPYDDSSVAVQGSDFTNISHTKDPHVLLDGSTYYMVMSCYDTSASRWGVCLASASDPYGTWTAVSSTPVIAGTGTGDHENLYNPQIIKDNSAPSGERYSIMYVGTDTSPALGRYLHRAYASSVGASWTADSNNPIIGPGSETWNDAGIERFHLEWDGFQWYGFTGEQDTDGTGNPNVVSNIFGPDLSSLQRTNIITFNSQTSGCDTTLSSGTTDGRVLNLNSATNCSVGQVIEVTDDTTANNFIWGVITDVSGSAITLLHQHSGETTSGAFLRSMQEFLRIDVSWYFNPSPGYYTVWATCFNQFGDTGGASIYSEPTCVLEKTPGGSWEMTHWNTFLPGLVRENIHGSAQHFQSHENISFVMQPVYAKARNRLIGMK